MHIRYTTFRSLPALFGLGALLLAVALPPEAAWAKQFSSTISGGTAFRDKNKDGLPSADEKTALTDADGSFKLPNGKGRVFLRGGIDIETGLPNSQLLTTPPAAKAVGTLSALWQALLDRKQPGAKIKKMVNVKGNVTVVNFVAKRFNQIKPKSKAETLVKRNAQQQTVVQFLKSLAGKNTLRMAAAGEAAPCQIAANEDPEIAALACALIGLEPLQRKQWIPLDLTNAETVKNLFIGAGVTVGEPNLTILANAAADLNRQIEAGTSVEEITALAQRAAAEARLVAAGRYSDLQNAYAGRTPLLTGVIPDTGSNVTDAVTNDPNPVLRGVVGSGAVKVRVYEGEGFVEIDVGSAGVWSYTPGGVEGLQDGAYSFTFSSLDDSVPPVESALSPTTVLVIDTTAPQAATVRPLQTNDTTPTLTGSWQPEDSLAVTVNGVTYSGSDLSFVGAGWSLTIPDANALAIGTYDVTTTVTDLAGNVTQQVAKGVLTVQTAPTGLFGAGAASAVGTQPIAVARGDFNNDGWVDWAVANQGADSVSILLGNGDGSFQAASTVVVGANPYALATGFIDQDGNADLAVAVSGANAVVILAGNGSGGFAAPVSYTAGSSPRVVVATDLNRDSYLDMVVTNVNEGVVFSFTNNGDGTFPSVPTLVTSSINLPGDVAVADVNGDGNRDLVVAHTADPAVSVLLSNGDGGFFNPVDYSTAAGATGVAVGDVNADGKIDIVTANNAGDNISVLRNDGTGGFPSHLDYPAGTQARNVAIGDIDGDGRPDLAVTSAAGATVGILRGNVDGTFQAPVSYPTGQTPWGLALGDLDGDDKPDLAVTNWGDGTVSVLLNQRINNLFQPKADYPVANTPYAIGAADLDGDSVPDLATANIGEFIDGVPTAGSVSVLRNQGSGTFSAKVDYPTQPNGLLFGSIVMGLLNGDTVPDIMVTNANVSGSGLSLLLGTGNGAFAGEPLVYSLPSPPSGMVAGLLDADLAPDLVVLQGDTVNVYTSNGQVAVPTTPAFTYPVASGSLQGLVLAQIDGSGGLDLAVTNATTDQVLVLLGNGDGSFSDPVGFATGATPFSVAAGDVNGDTETDLAVANFGSDTVSLLLRSGGIFQTKVDFPVGFAPRAVALADLNRDGDLDMVVASEAAATVSVLIGNGQGGFWAPVPYGVGGFAFSLAVADFDSDGNPDLASGNWGTNSVTVRLNASP
jgi:hypothetical protein